MTADLQAVADRQEIGALLARIAQLADSGTPEDYIGCFTRDAVWDLTDATDLPMDVQRISGRTDLLTGVRERRAAGIQGPGSRTRHDVSTIVVDVTGDQATAQSYFRYYRGVDAVPSLVAMGTYRDRFVRDGSGWLLQHRVISRD